MTRKDLELDVIMRVYEPDLKKMKTWKAPKAEMLKKLLKETTMGIVIWNAAG